MEDFKQMAERLDKFCKTYKDYSFFFLLIVKYPYLMMFTQMTCIRL